MDIIKEYIKPFMVVGLGIVAVLLNNMPLGILVMYIYWQDTKSSIDYREDISKRTKK